jgi:hypothetical protein
MENNNNFFQIKKNDFKIIIIFHFVDVETDPRLQ